MVCPSGTQGRSGWYCGFSVGGEGLLERYVPLGRTGRDDGLVRRTGEGLSREPAGTPSGTLDRAGRVVVCTTVHPNAEPKTSPGRTSES